MLASLPTLMDLPAMRRRQCSSPIYKHLFLLHFVMRDVRDVGVAGSNPVTPTTDSGAVTRKYRLTTTRTALVRAGVQTRLSSVQYAFLSCERVGLENAPNFQLESSCNDPATQHRCRPRRRVQASLWRQGNRRVAGRDAVTDSHSSYETAA